MAGSLLDSLVDAFPEDDPDDYFGGAFPDKEASGSKQMKGSDQMKLPSFTEAADYMMRAMKMATPTHQLDAPANTGQKLPLPNTTSAGPDEQLEYYRRMVQMQDEDAESEDSGGSIRGFEGLSLIEDNYFADDIAAGSDAGKAPVAKSLQVCAEFTKAGDCKDGINCGFVHDGAFRRGGGKGHVTVDPEDFFRRALQLRSSARKLNNIDPEQEQAFRRNLMKAKADAGRVSVPVPDRWVPSVGSW